MSTVGCGDAAAQDATAAAHLHHSVSNIHQPVHQQQQQHQVLHHSALPHQQDHHSNLPHLPHGLHHLHAAAAASQPPPLPPPPSVADVLSADSVVTSVHGVPLPQTPEDPTVLQQSHHHHGLGSGGILSTSLPPPSIVPVSKLFN